MPRQTDRQTDKATFWSVTAFGDEILTILSGNYPDQVDWVMGQVEKCPTSGRDHYQGMIKCHNQQRLSALKKWLPTAHLEVCRDRSALAKYVQKDETRVGNTGTIQNTNSGYLSTYDALVMLGRHVHQTMATAGLYREEGEDPEEFYKRQYWQFVREILRTSPRYVSTFLKPDILRGWVNTHEVWVDLGRQQLREESRGPPPTPTALSDAEQMSQLSDDVFERSSAVTDFDASPIVLQGSHSPASQSP